MSDKKKISADINKNLLDKIEKNNYYGYRSRQKLIENLLIKFMYKRNISKSIEDIVSKYKEIYDMSDRDANELIQACKKYSIIK